MAKFAHHALEGTVGVGMATSIVVAVLLVVLLLVENVVLALANRVGGEDVLKLVAAGVLVGPLLDGVEHVALDLDTVLAEGRVVQCAEDIVDDLIYRDTRVLPGVQRAPLPC